MTVLETFKFAFDSMSGGTHGSLVVKEGLNDDQKDLISWMDSTRFKVTFAKPASRCDERFYFLATRGV